MEKKKDYIQDIADIRSMMERSSKFLSLSGWAGIMAGIYALVGAYIAYAFFKFNPTEVAYSTAETATPSMVGIVVLALCILLLSVGTAIWLSYQRATKRAEPIWNATSRRLLAGTATPLVAGGVMALVFIAHGLIGLLAPITLLFYGLALYSAGNYTYREVRYLGIILVTFGLLGSFAVEYGLLLWAIGFGLMHIIYGIYIHIKYER